MSEGKAPKPIKVANSGKRDIPYWLNRCTNYLNKINKLVIDSGLTPRFNSIDEIMKPLGDEAKDLQKIKKLHGILKKAFNDKAIDAYSKPGIVINPPRSATPIKIQSLPKQNFPSNQMSMDIENQNTGLNVIDAFAKTGSSKTFGDDEYRKHHQDAMKSLWEHTGHGWGITHNSNMMKKDYLDRYVKGVKPSSSVDKAFWDYEYKDMDGDEVPDVLVYDGPVSNPKSNLRYFNGYGWNKSKVTDYRNKYFTDPKLNKGDYSNEGFQSFYKTTPGYKAPKPKPYDDTIKQFVSVISKACGEIMKGSKDRLLKLDYQKSGFQGKLKSLCYRYVAIPAVLLASKKYTEDSIRKLVFAEPDTAAYESLRRVMANKDIRAILNDGNNTIVKDIIIPALTQIGNGLINHCKELNGEAAVKFIIGIYKDQTDIDKHFYAIIVNTVKA